MSSSGMRGTSPTIASSGSQEPDARRLIAEYEEALTAALAETDQIRVSQAFDRADRLQHRLLRLTRTAPSPHSNATDPMRGQFIGRDLDHYR